MGISLEDHGQVLLFPINPTMRSQFHEKIQVVSLKKKFFLMHRCNNSTFIMVMNGCFLYLRSMESGIMENCLVLRQEPREFQQIPHRPHTFHCALKCLPSSLFFHRLLLIKNECRWSILFKEFCMSRNWTIILVKIKPVYFFNKSGDTGRKKSYLKLK